MYVHSSMCLWLLLLQLADICCHFSRLKWFFFFSFSSFFSRFEPKICIHEYLMLSRIIRIMCKMLFIYSFIVSVSQRMSLYACICMLSFMWPYAMHAMPCHATLCPACVGVHIFVRYKLEHKYRMQNVSLLVNLYIFVCRKSQLIHKCKHKHKHKCTYHTWFVVQCVNTQTLHSMRMQMQMLNAQIGLDGFEKVRRKFSQRFIICIQFKIAANRISNFAFKFDRIAANKTKTNEFETKTLESFHQIIQAVLIALSYSTQWIFNGRDSGNFLCEIGFW